MAFQLLLVSCYFFDRIEALAFSQPTPTSREQGYPILGQGWTPKPTEAPYSPWLIGSMSHDQLLRRQDENLFTCGWFNGNAQSPIACGPNSYCGWYSSPSPAYFACCTEKSSSVIWNDCVYVGACLNNGDEGNDNTGEDGYVDDSTTLCGTAAPSCYSIQNLDGYGGTWWYQGCDTETGTYYAKMYTDPSSDPPSSTSSKDPSSDGASSNPGSNSSPASGSTPASSNAAPNSNSGSSQGSGSEGPTSSNAPNSHSSSSTPSSSSQPSTTSSTSSSKAPSTTSTPPSTTSSSTPSIEPPGISAGPGNGVSSSNNNPGVTQTGSDSPARSHSTSSSTPTPKPTHPNSVDVAAVAGGTVGGVAAVAILGALIGFLAWRKKRQRVEPMPEISQYNPVPNPYGYNPYNQSTNY